MSLHGYTPAEAFEVRVRHASEAVCAFDPDAAAYQQRTEAWVRVALAAQDARERELNPQYVDSDMEIAALTARVEALTAALREIASGKTAKTHEAVAAAALATSEQAES